MCPHEEEEEEVGEERAFRERTKQAGSGPVSYIATYRIEGSV